MNVRGLPVALSALSCATLMSIGNACAHGQEGQPHFHVYEADPAVVAAALEPLDALLTGSMSVICGANGTAPPDLLSAVTRALDHGDADTLQAVRATVADLPPLSPQSMSTSDPLLTWLSVIQSLAVTMDPAAGTSPSRYMFPPLDDPTMAPVRGRWAELLDHIADQCGEAPE